LSINCPSFIPVKIENRVLAVLAIGSLTSEKVTYLHHIQTMQPLLNVAAIALDHAHLYREVEMARQEAHLAHRAAEAASQSKSQFLANISHEIRTPLNGILGMADLVRDTDLDSGQREYMEIVKDSAEALLTIVNDVLDFSKIEAGKLELENTPFRLRPLIHSTIQAFIPKAQEKKLALDWSVDQQVPDNLLGDSGRLRQILANLLSNALKFTLQGYISSQAKEIVNFSPLVHRRATLQIFLPYYLDMRISSETLAAEQIQLHIAVRDTGIGIPPHKQGDIFAAFTQADGSTTQRFGGTGLGLSISAELAAIMDGRIWVESTQDQGSTFHVVVNIAIGTRTSDKTESPVAEHGQRPQSILLAEDIYFNQKVAKVMLEKLGHEVEVAADGRQAIEAWEHGAFDLVLMDVQMPYMDGLEATAASPDKKHVPIIALTAYALKGDQEASYRPVWMTTCPNPSGRRIWAGHSPVGHRPAGLRPMY
jgi:signal transduction histidine kinase/CheY-like chemotaxis protein